MSQEEDSAWRLIAVLQSTVFLPPALSVKLYRTAVRLHHAQAEVEELSDEATGVGLVRNLRRELLLGTFGGPGFEAELETPRGKGFVRFIVTQEGLDHDERQRDARKDFERRHWN